MIERNKDLLAAINLYNEMQKISYNGYKFYGYGACYQQTNEKLLALLSKIDLSKTNKALTVTASGDHILNLLTKGITNIDTFDSNRLTEYYALGFKLVAAKCLDKEQFFKLFTETPHSKENIALQKFVISCAPEQYRWFWQNSFIFLDNEKNEHQGIFEICRKKVENHIDNNIYLQSSQNYLAMQQALNKSNITFNHLNVTQIPENLGTYDFIYLSNIFEYRQKIFGTNDSVTDVAELVESIYKNNLNMNGELFYLYVIFRNYQEIMNSIKIAETKIYRDKNLRVLSLKK